MTATELIDTPNFQRYAALVLNGEMTLPALRTMYGGKASVGTIEQALNALKAAQTPPQEEETASDIAVNSFFGDAPEYADEEAGEIQVRNLTQIEPETLYDGDLSIPMTGEEARRADASLKRLYDEAQRLGRRFIHDVYPFKERKGWIPLGFKNFENWYSDRFPNLAVKDAYRLLREHEVRLRLEPLIENVPNVVNLPGKALEVISHLPAEQQPQAAIRAVEMAQTKEVHGVGKKFHNPDKPSARDAQRAVAELKGEVFIEPKPTQRKPFEAGEGFLTDSQHAQIAMKRTVQAQHLQLVIDDGTPCVRVNMCEEAYKDARFLDLPLLVMIGIAESQSYEWEVTDGKLSFRHVDPFAA